MSKNIIGRKQEGGLKLERSGLRWLKDVKSDLPELDVTRVGIGHMAFQMG